MVQGPSKDMILAFLVLDVLHFLIKFKIVFHFLSFFLSFYHSRSIDYLSVLYLITILSGYFHDGSSKIPG